MYEEPIILLGCFAGLALAVLATKSKESSKINEIELDLNLQETRESAYKQAFTCSEEYPKSGRNIGLIMAGTGIAMLSGQMPYIVPITVCAMLLVRQDIKADCYPAWLRCLNTKKDKTEIEKEFYSLNQSLIFRGPELSILWFGIALFSLGLFKMMVIPAIYLLMS